jgi:hypothetical protein
MTTQNCQFLITDAGAQGFARRKAYDVSDLVEVRDLTTQDVVKIKAGDVSIFRHTLFVEGKPCRVLNILK